MKLKKQDFHQHKRPISIKNIDINKIEVSNKISFCKKGLICFIGYKDTKTNRPLCASMYRTDFGENKYVVFNLTKDDELSEKY